MKGSMKHLADQKVGQTPQRGRRNRKRGQKSGSTGGDLAAVSRVAQRAWGLVKTLAAVINTEFKFYDATGSTTYDYNGTLIGPINTPSQGDGDSNRDGDSLRLQYTTVNLKVQNAAAATGTLVRVLIFLDKSNSSGGVADLIETAYVASVYGPIAPLEEDQVARYKVLQDRCYAVDSTGNSFIADSFTIRYPAGGGEHTHFSAGSTTIVSGALKMIIISDRVTSNLPTVTWFTRTFYTDN